MEKTRIIAFGRHAADERRKDGLGKPETFDFLGFTLLWEKRQGTFRVKRKTSAKKFRPRSHGRRNGCAGTSPHQREVIRMLVAKLRDTTNTTG